MKVKEFITSSWYEYPGGDETGLHPWEGETKAKYSGPPTPWTYLQDEKKYTWMKSPRYDGLAMQVGPLARALVGFAGGHDDMREMVAEVLKRLDVGPSVLFSTLGRTAARGIETVLVARRMSRWFDELVTRIKGGDVKTFTGEAWEPDTWPATCQGYGFLDAPRGALGHWVQIANGKISRYQCVVPSTWNCSPRDAQGVPGAYESALLENHPLVDPKRPIEILRTVHSFDPCMSCGVHVLDATGAEVTEVRVQ
jgi:Ni,Fe-hydrogenase I large subunit